MESESYYLIHKSLPHVPTVSQMILGQATPNLLILRSILILSTNSVILKVEYHLTSRRTLSQKNLGHATPTYLF